MGNRHIVGFSKEYFSDSSKDPDPLRAEVGRRVRFEEVDALGMVWHGRYPSYFEDGRIAFGDSYDLSYHTFRENDTVAPVVQMHVDYKHPLRFDQMFTIEARLHWSEAVRLNFSYHLLNSEKSTIATGYTVQLLTDIQGTVLLLPPDWLVDFRQKWKEGLAQNR